jgi:cyclic nucleotide gated channel
LGVAFYSTFANDLEPTSNWLEVIFSIVMVLSGLLLFTLLIGNIQVFLHAVMAKKRKMQIRCRDMEWWMKRRQLPSRLRQRVRRFERQRWNALGGEDELELIHDLPPGLRRDIKRYLCFDLINKVLGSRLYTILLRLVKAVSVKSLTCLIFLRCHCSGAWTT